METKDAPSPLLLLPFSPDGQRFSSLTSLTMDRLGAAVASHQILDMMRKLSAEKRVKLRRGETEWTLHFNCLSGSNFRAAVQWAQRAGRGRLSSLPVAVVVVVVVVA